MRATTPTPDYVIRLAMLEDAPRLRGQFSPMRIGEDMQVFGLWAWIAWQGQVALGGITVAPADAEGRLTPPPWIYAVIPTLYVDPAWRGHGLGRALLDHAVADLRARGFVRVSLHTNTDSDEARGLYESSGWVVTDQSDNVVGYALNLD